MLVQNLVLNLFVLFRGIYGLIESYSVLSPSVIFALSADLEVKLRAVQVHFVTFFASNSQFSLPGPNKNLVSSFCLRLVHFTK